MIQLETLIELKFFNLTFQAYPLIELRQTILYRAIRADSISINSTLSPSEGHQLGPVGPAEARRAPASHGRPRRLLGTGLHGK